MRKSTWASPARTHAAMNPFTVQLGIAPVDSVASEASGWVPGDDAPQRCPVLVAEAAAVDKTARPSHIKHATRAAASVRPEPGPRSP